MVLSQLLLVFLLLDSLLTFDCVEIGEKCTEFVIVVESTIDVGLPPAFVAKTRAFLVEEYVGVLGAHVDTAGVVDVCGCCVRVE